MNVERSSLAVLITGICIGVVLGAGMMVLIRQTRPVPILIMPPEPTPLPTPEPTPGLMNVYVNGAVANPAIYQLPPGSLVEQAIEAAGGFINEANTAVINLAQPLTDGVQVYVPTQEETTNKPPAGVSDPVTADSPSTGNLINLNTATLEELDTLPGIGPSTAQNIVTFREQNGSFATIEAIMDVPGIGQAKFDQIEEMITVGD